MDLVTLDDLSAAALLESSARIEALANAWDRMNSEPPLAAPLASLPDPTKTAGVFGQFGTLCKRYISYKQPGSLLSWISRLIVAAVLSLVLGCIFWDIPASDPQLTYNDRLGYHHTVMGIAFWPIILFMIRDNQNDRKNAEKDIKLGLYGRGVYIFVQSVLSLLPSLCIWLAYLLPAHSMAGLYSYTANSDAGIYLYMGELVTRKSLNFLNSSFTFRIHDVLFDRHSNLSIIFLPFDFNPQDCCVSFRDLCDDRCKSVSRRLRRSPQRHA